MERELYTTVKVGQVVYLSISERTDEFRHKRYSTIHRGRTVIIRAVVEDINGNQFRARLEGNGNFEREGQVYVFGRGSMLVDQRERDPKELGKWKQWDRSEYKKA